MAAGQTIGPDKRQGEGAGLAMECLPGGKVRDRMPEILWNLDKVGAKNRRMVQKEVF